MQLHQPCPTERQPLPEQPWGPMQLPLAPTQGPPHHRLGPTAASDGSSWMTLASSGRCLAASFLSRLPHSGMCSLHLSAVSCSVCAPCVCALLGVGLYCVPFWVLALDGLCSLGYVLPGVHSLKVFGQLYVHFDMYSVE